MSQDFRAYILQLKLIHCRKRINTIIKIHVQIQNDHIREISTSWEIFSFFYYFSTAASRFEQLSFITSAITEKVINNSCTKWTKFPRSGKRASFIRFSNLLVSIVPTSSISTVLRDNKLTSACLRASSASRCLAMRCLKFHSTNDFCFRNRLH